jgi:hypothetical protein
MDLHLRRIADLPTLLDQLLHNDLSARFACPFYTLHREDYCNYDCTYYSAHHARIFRNAGKHLLRDAENVQKQNFVDVMRTLFCSDHDINSKRKDLQKYRLHLEGLWEDASREMKNDIWDALRRSGRDLYPPSLTPQRPPLQKVTASAPAKLSDGNSTALRDTPPPFALTPDTSSRPSTPYPALGHSADQSKNGSPGDSPSHTLCLAHAFLKQGINTEATSPYNSPRHDATTPLASPLMPNTQGVHSTTNNHVDCKKDTLSVRRRLDFKAGVDQTCQPARTASHSQISEATEEPQAELGHTEEHDVASFPPKIALQGPVKDAPTLEFVSTPTSADPSAPPELTPTSTPGGKQRKLSTSSAQKGSLKSCEFDKLRPETIAASISKILKNNITEKKGYIYVLAAPGFFETFPPARHRAEKWVKIGIAADVKERVKTLRAKCGITDLGVVYQSDSRTEMDLLSRIETVCHEELNNFRRRLTCNKQSKDKPNGCGKVHEEWFAVEEEVAERTVKRWRRFLVHKPYDKHGILNTFWRDRLEGENYCSFENIDGEAGHGLMDTKFDLWLERSSLEIGKRTAS